MNHPHTQKNQNFISTQTQNDPKAQKSVIRKSLRWRKLNIKSAVNMHANHFSVDKKLRPPSAVKNTNQMHSSIYTIAELFCSFNPD
jgi:hypothetical protein